MWKSRSGAGAFHALIAWGFVFYLLVNLGDLVQGYFPVRFLGEGAIGAGYRFVADVVTVGILIGTVYFLARRFVVRAGELGYHENVMLVEKVKAGAIGRDSLLVGLCILLHVGFRLLGESFGIALARQAAVHAEPGEPYTSGGSLQWGGVSAWIGWRFAQSALASAVRGDLGGGAWGEGLPAAGLGVVVLVWAVLISSLYGRRPELIRVYERLLRYMVWGIVVCFAWVVIRTGISDWGGLFRGFVGFAVPGERNGVLGVTVILSGLSAAVGINMVFLYPYSLLARGWSREHRSLARFDLWTGTFVPYVLAASLMVIAAANTIHLDPAYDGVRLSPVEAAQSLAAVAGPAVGRVVFDLGVLGMALSTITLHMLATGFVACELFGWDFGSRKHRLAMLLPAPGVLGPVFWGDIAVWLAVPTNIVCGLFLPAAYVGFVMLQKNRGYLGEDRPSGGRGWVWWGAMVAVTVFLTGFMAWYVLTQGPSYFERFAG